VNPPRLTQRLLKGMPVREGSVVKRMNRKRTSIVTKVYSPTSNYPFGFELDRPQAGFRNWHKDDIGLELEVVRY
jgi:hypothetical protein